MNEFYSVFYLIIIAFLNSIDNLGVAIAFSIAGTKVPVTKNILLSTMAFAVSFVSALSGDYISNFLNENTCNILSMLLLVIMGLRMIHQSFRKKEESLEKYSVISNKEAITVGIILALDDVGSSVSSGLIGYSAFMVSIPFFVISFIFFFLANFSTRFISRLNIGKKATIVSGILMILLGILRLFG